MTDGKRRTPSAGSPAKALAAERIDFPALVKAIRRVHADCAAQAGRAVNISLTLRNWVIGWYIREYEQNGADRAAYGEALIDTLAGRLRAEGTKDLAARTLRQCRQFYSVYPGIWRMASAESLCALLPKPIWRTLSAKSDPMGSAYPTGHVPTETAEPPATPMGAPREALFSSLSFSHLVELIAIDDPLKRAFYEIECIRGSWSVRELKRQIATLYFERSGLSKDREKLAAMVQAGAQTAEPKLAIRDPYIFEFLGLNAKDAVDEFARREHLPEGSK